MKQMHNIKSKLQLNIYLMPHLHKYIWSIYIIREVYGGQMVKWVTIWHRVIGFVTIVMIMINEDWLSWC
jgi:hypothetical protein